MKKLFRALLTLALLPTAALAAKTEITIGFNPAENADVVETNGKAFSDYFKKQTGLSVKTFIATDYTALIEAMRSGRVDFAFLPPFSFVKAEEIAGAKVLMKSVRNGQPLLYSALITRADKGINKVEDAKGKNIAWVDPASATGFIVPKAALLKKGLDPDKFFNRQVYAGSHDALVLAVVNGTVDVGATFSNDAKGEMGSWKQFLKSPAEQKKIKVLLVTDPIPGDTMATTAKFEKDNKELVEKTVKLLEEMGKNPEGKKILTALYRIDAMVKATSKDFQSVRDAAKAVGIE